MKRSKIIHCALECFDSPGVWGFVQNQRKCARAFERGPASFHSCVRPAIEMFQSWDQVVGDEAFYVCRQMNSVLDDEDDVFDRGVLVEIAHDPRHFFAMIKSNNSSQQRKIFFVVISILSLDLELRISKIGKSQTLLWRRKWRKSTQFNNFHAIWRLKIDKNIFYINHLCNNIEFVRKNFLKNA